MMKYLSGTLLLAFFVFGIFLYTASSQDFGRRERTYDVQHIKIDVKFEESQKKVIGKVTTTIKAMRPQFKDFRVDAVAMTINKVTGENRSQLHFDYDSSKLTIHLDKPCPADAMITYSVEYECIPTRGLYFIQPDASFPRDPNQIWTQGQGEDNRFWMPCYDFPNDKATSEVIMTVRDSYTTLSNGYLKRVVENKKEKTKTWHWVMDKPHSSYLIMLAAGEFEIYRDQYGKIPVESYYYKWQTPSDVKRTYSTTAAIVKFFSQKIGVEYPWVKYAQIPVANFMYGGMENTTATVMNDKRMVVDARAALDYSPDGLIAHELAHQWWGDYLTYIDWWNGWLNEGFATFFNQAWTQHHFGEDEYRYQRFGAIEGYIGWVKSAGRIPVVTDKPNGGANIYGKGAAILHMGRSYLGEELFWKAINAYAKKYAHQSVETNDFKRTIEDVTGFNLHWFFNQWLYKAGYPELKVMEKWDERSKKLTLTVLQTQKPDSVCGNFRLPVDIQFMTTTSNSIERVMVDSSKSVFTFILPSKPLLVSFDHGSNLCAKIDYPKSTIDLIYQLLNDEDIVQRIQAGRVLIERSAEPNVLDVLKRSIQNDSFYGVRQHLVERLADLNVDTIQFRSILKDIFLIAVHDSRSSIRASALGGLRKMKDETLRRTFENMLRDSSYHVLAASLQCLAGLDSNKAIPLLRKYLTYPSYRDVIATTVIELLTQFQARETITDIRDLASPGGSLQLRSTALDALGTLGGRDESVFEFFKERLKEPSANIREVAVRSLAKLKNEKTPAVLKEVLQSDVSERVKTVAKKLLDR